MRAGGQSPTGAPLFDVLAAWPAGPAALDGALRRVDPASLVHAAARHGLSVWLADTLGARVDAWPDAARRRLSDDARRTVAAGLRMKRLTAKVLAALGDAGLTVVPLKGYGLATRLFPQQPLGRPSADVDVLVPRAQLALGAQVLLGLGLRQVADAGLDDVFEEHHHLSFDGPPGLVELHFRLFTGFGGAAFPDEALQARWVPGTLDGRPVHWLSPGDEFCYLATHAANHAFLRASWLVDLVRFLEVYPALPWPQMAEAMRASGLFEAVAVTLAVLQRTGLARVPGAARDAFEVQRLRTRLEARLFTPQALESARWSADRLAGFGLRLALVDSPRHGLRHVVDGARRAVRRARETLNAPV